MDDRASRSPPSLSISGVGSSAGGSVIGLLSSPSSVVFMFALPLPLPVYLGFLGIPVIGQKHAVLTNLFAVNDMKCFGFVYLSSLQFPHLSDAPRRQLFWGIVKGYRTKLLRILPGSLTCLAYSSITGDLGLTSHLEDY